MFRAIAGNVTLIERFSEHKLRKIMAKEKKREFSRKVLIYFDDPAGNNISIALQEDSMLGHLFSAGRHKNMSMVYSSQKINSMVPTVVRTQVDGSVTFAMENPSEMKAWNETFGFCDYKDFKGFFHDIVNRPYDFLYNNRKGPISKWYKNLNYSVQQRVNCLKLDDRTKSTSTRKVIQPERKWINVSSKKKTTPRKK